MNNATVPMLRQQSDRYPTGQLAGGAILPGKHVYRLEHILHLSNLSAIYLATDLKRQREVVIKEVSYRHWQPHQRGHAIQLLEREAAMLTMLHRWKIPAPRCLDLFKFQGRTYLVMTRVAGENLHVLAQAHQVTPEMATKIVIRVGKLVQRLHAHGYVHHDIKPANIILQPNGQPILIDYGSAARIRRVEDRPSFSTGTMEFMSLEQARGEVRPGNDLFALGRTLEVLVPQPTQRLALILDRATSPAPMRYQTIADFIHDLQRGHISSAARKTSLPQSIATARLPLSLGVFVAMLIFVLLIQPLGTEPLKQLFVLSPAATPGPVLKGIAIPAVHHTLPLARLKIPPPIQAHELIRQCYEQYQRSRIETFEKLDMHHLQCVDQGSRLWEYIQSALDDLQAHGYWRQIMQRSEIKEVTVGADGVATVVVSKVETRVDFPTPCDGLVRSSGCQAVYLVQDEQYQAIFRLKLTSSGWRLVDVIVLD